MTLHESALKTVIDPTVTLLICALLTLVAASPSNENILKLSKVFQFAVVGTISALAASSVPIISVILMMLFFCLTA